ncbi:MAG TPA: hypothetical protein PLA71_00075 [Saccharofermentans sp.]|nr:hypothetical protein [Saccharofermentans sp.]
MNKQLFENLKEIIQYYDKTRRIGHTDVSMNGILHRRYDVMLRDGTQKNAPIFVLANEAQWNLYRNYLPTSQADVKPMSIFSDLSTKLVGQQRPLAFDNSALYAIFKECLNRIEQLTTENKKLEKEVEDQNQSDVHKTVVNAVSVEILEELQKENAKLLRENEKYRFINEHLNVEITKVNAALGVSKLRQTTQKEDHDKIKELEKENTRLKSDKRGMGEHIAELKARIIELLDEIDKLSVAEENQRKGLSLGLDEYEDAGYPLVVDKGEVKRLVIAKRSGEMTWHYLSKTQVDQAVRNKVAFIYVDDTNNQSAKED